MINVRAIFQQDHRVLAIEAMPSLLLPEKGRYKLRDYETIFGPDLKNGNDIFDFRGVEPKPVPLADPWAPPRDPGIFLNINLY